MTILKSAISNKQQADVWQQTANNKEQDADSASVPFFEHLNDSIHNHRKSRTSVLQGLTRSSKELADRSDLLMNARSEHLNQHRNTIQSNTNKLAEDIHNLANSWLKVSSPQEMWQEWLSYSSDASKRLIQTADVLRERGDIFLEHQEAGCPPVLDYEYEVIMDASEFHRPSNYVLLKILPPEGIVTSDSRRPYVIIDPRAGHGAGIGGFKHDSQVGVALNDGHSVYFVAFKRLPEPGQTVADVTYAEARFVREVRRRHPDANPPVVVGNCQGGWAALVLAATNPDITGPIVMNGSPVSAWSGEVGVNPMRYNAGVQGGTWLAMLTSDLGNGKFDGAWLVNNFELLNPSRNYLGKYYDLYKNPTKNRERFLSFERWWGGFFLMNEEEIRWIVENIFIGNRISRNTAQIEKGTNVDIRNIKAPIIVFASHGDNITPPQQALNWILDTYTDERDVEVCGQRIVYMVHEKVGHLGIFVSSSIARREHKGMASILKMIEALAPGLYELVLEDYQGSDEDMKFYVTFKHRTFDDIHAIDDGRLDEKPFQAVHRFSKAQARTYETWMRPMVKLMSNENTAEFLRNTHPQRIQRSLWSSKNPIAKMVSNASQAISEMENNEESFIPNPEDKKSSISKQQSTLQGANAAAIMPAIESLQQDNPFLQVEKLWIDTMTMSLDLWRDWRSISQEMMFYSMWTMPWMREYGRSEISRRLKNQATLNELPAVEEALSNIEEGGIKEAVVRMLILTNMMSEGGIHRDKLLLITEILTRTKPFIGLDQEELSELLHQQTIIVRFEKDKAIETLPKLLTRKADREKALKTIRYVIGNYEDMSLVTRNALNKLYEVFGFDDIDEDGDVDSNPLEVVAEK